MKVKLKKLNENVKLPVYAKTGDAGLDIKATRIESENNYSITYGTDLCIEVPFGYVGLIFPRSSIRNYDLSLSNCVGVVDSGYRGEIMATFKKTKLDGMYYVLDSDYEGEIMTTFKKTKLDGMYYDVDDKIMQIIILPYPSIEFEFVDELSETERGEGGFGHTGK